MIQIFRGLLGILILLAICYLISRNRKKIDWKMVGSGLVLQLVLAFCLIEVGWIRKIFEVVVRFFSVMIEASQQSSQFLFGDLAKPGTPYGFAFLVLPTIIFFSALSSVLYYFGILQKVVGGFAWLMRKTFKLSGAESLATAANVFIGQTEAPLVIKPYLERMTRSELLCLMVGGMATIAGSVFGAYMGMLGGADEASRIYFGMHLLTASIISAPAAIICAKMIYPEDQKVDNQVEINQDEVGSNFLDALSRGTTDGLKLAVNVGAMLLAFMAFVYLINMGLNGIGSYGLNDWVVEFTNGSHKSFDLQFIFGILFAPIAWIIGIDVNYITSIGQLLGEKTILNEFVAYLSLGEMKTAGILDQRSIVIATYALCGFSNFASIGIQIGGISAIAPGQRNNLTAFGLLALIGGTLACLMTACIAGALYR
ncbi:MAG: Na+ dependent nucleoside transporter [Saprospiraceae bacterium]|nr:Na+ dependent nucleoside transporter [Saprospiraceae bacterium]MBK7812751.1 Na+ dependent nucleoside transporter [Saprospiraceae bacterium]MBK9630942.1 Na+ dependent nucleoside transporter [Saprospiraceae bacterium]